MSDLRVEPGVKARGAGLRHSACIVLFGLAVVGCSFDSAPILDPRNGNGGGASDGGEGGSAADGGSGGRSGAGAGGSGGQSGIGGAGGTGGSGAGGGGTGGDGGPCTPNAFIECQGATAIRCNGDGASRLAQDCGMAGCNSGEQRCNVCAPGEKFCSNSSTLATCGNNGLVSGMQACDQGCNGSTAPAVCNACAPSASFCLDADTLRSCDAQGNAASDTDCPNGCTDGSNGTATCNACLPNAVLGCEDANTQRRCKADGSGPETLACSNGCSGAGDCNVCVPNSKSCSGGMLRTCTSNGTSFTAQSCTYGCSTLTGTAACNQCAPSAAECRSDNLVQCTATGTIASSTSCSYGCDASATPHACSPPTLEPSNLPTDTCDTQATLDLSVAAAGSLSIDTDGIVCNSVVMQAGSLPEICVVRRRDITIGTAATVTVAGSRLLALVATRTMTIQGVIDASANGAVPGPGARTSGAGVGGTASALPQAGEETPANAGGGGGGFGSAGAKGGDGSVTCGMAPCASGGSAGVQLPSDTLSPLRGGSNGGRNSSGSSSQRQALPGGGGGGLQLVSCNTLTIATTAVLDVSGGGGQGGRPGMVGGTSETPGAGAGGGSGGGLLIEAQTITFGTGATLVANGGGGGGGGTRSGGMNKMQFISGEDGDDGARSASAANGGNAGGDTSLAGGRGGALNNYFATAGGSATEDASAAGGGGGAGGRIRINNTSGSIGTPLVLISPMPSVGQVSLK